MSFAADHVAAVDAQLEQLPVSGLSHAATDDQRDGQPAVTAAGQPVSSDELGRLQNLQSLIKSLSSSTKTLPHVYDLLGTLRKARLSRHCTTCRQNGLELEGQSASVESLDTSYEHELEWLLIGKVANRAYGLVLDSLIRQSLPLSNEVWYWSQVINSQRYLGLYTIQVSPLRFWSWSRSVWNDARARGGDLQGSWRHFYGLVSDVIRDRSLLNVQRQLASPLILSRQEIRSKIASLNRAKLLDASGIGYLLSAGFNDQALQIGNHHHPTTLVQDPAKQQHRWKSTIVNSITVMDAVLNTTGDDELPVDEFESTTEALIRDDPWDDYGKKSNDSPSSLSAVGLVLKPSEAADRLEQILSAQLPTFVSRASSRLKADGRPSTLVRYWLPATVLLFSSSAILRLIANRKAEIIEWIRGTGATMIDFWNNWVIEPTKKIIGTIRHNEESEVSIMSKRSLEGDRDSLERMVVDFAVENPDGPALSESEIAEIRSKVQEGDVTPVLRAYERELKSPLYGSIRGNLIRTLLIQVQKTKVDVEVAMRGIDNLLKSQELVFGFVGLTPGILVCLGIFRWIRTLPGSRRHSQQLQKQSQAYLVLRNVDRILTSSPQSDAGMLSFKEYGLLVCEAIVLRDVARRTFPKQIFEEFIQDFNDLIDSQSGVGRQIRVADRIRWAYAKWL